MSKRKALAIFASPLRLFLATCVIAIASMSATKYGGPVAAFWLANAGALVVLLRLRPHTHSRALAWVAIAAALFVANYVCGNGLKASAWFTVGNLIEIAIAYAIFRARLGALTVERGGFASLLPSMLIAAIVAPACSALVVTGAMASDLGVTTWALWRQWWLPDLLGMLIVVPIGLFVSMEDVAKLREPHGMRRALVGLLVIACVLVLIVTTRLLAPMLIIAPLVMMAAVRFRALGAAVTIGLAAWGIVPLAAMDDAMVNAAVPETSHRIAMVQAFLALSGFLALGVSALLDERDALTRALDGRRKVAAVAAQSRLRLLMNVAHEIRTPLNVIQGCGEMAADAGPLNQRQKDLLDAVIAASKQLQVLASDLLESARLEHSAIALTPESIRPHDVIDAAIADVRASLAWDGPVLVSSGGETMWADPQRFRQVATNLISNAAKFGGGYGPVRVSVKAAGDVVLFSVSDCGPGFPPGREHEVFEPFAASSGQVTPASAGVGLSLVKQLVEAHGGKVRCISAPYLETRIEAEFPTEAAAKALARAQARDDLRSVDPDTVF